MQGINNLSTIHLYINDTHIATFFFEFPFARSRFFGFFRILGGAADFPFLIFFLEVGLWIRFFFFF
jgi:hypothetical protein